MKRRIAVGGMAEIFVADAPGIAGFTKTVALKLILPELAAEGDFLRMFFDEAKLTSAMSHPNITQVFELGEVDGRFFMAMEYVPGIDLAKLVRRLANKGESLTERIALSIVLDVLAGLHFAHDAKNETGEPLHLVHRDVSPHNVLLSRDGAVKLTDFGIAKAATQNARTRTGFVKGKFSYMSPEQASGQPVDRRADVFSAALVLYELLLGERVYQGEDELSIMQRARQGVIPPLFERKPAATRALSGILTRALAFDRDLRFATADELRQALAQFPIASRQELGALVRRFAGDEDKIDEDDGLDAIAISRAQEPPAPRRRAIVVTLGIGALSIAAAGAVWTTWPSDQVAVDPARAPAVIPTSTVAELELEPEPVPAASPEPEPKPRAAIGYLTINAQPWAYVSIDGKRLPNPTPLRRHPLRVGRHEVRLSSPSLGVEEERIVEVRAGKTTTLLHQFSSR